ncbi:MAG TPA: serine/threonine-protein kinase, partial [Polyangiaceae bacterium]|nr:serine/threonine-protein kinase [Polyangiaceae bacterium]
LVLEYLDGHTLRSALTAAGGALPLPRALGIVLELSDAVGAAHDLGIVHRDLKPENVMLVRRGDDPDFVKLLDFGLSRAGAGEAGLETRAGAILGTARYLSPEGARGEPVEPAADVYAIATLLFECLAGRPPFEGDRPVAILVKKASEAAPPLASTEKGAHVPAAIAELVDRGLARDPGARPRDARAFGRALTEATRASGTGDAEPFLRPTLFGKRTLSAGPAAPTRLFGSPAVATTSAPAAAAPLSREAPRSAARAPALGRLGVVAVCFVLGVLGALGIATHVSGCGGGP